MKRKLMIGSAVAAIAAGNLVPVASAALGALSWTEVWQGLALFNVFLVVPAVPAALLAAWVYSGDPDIRDGSPYINAMGITLLGFIGYFVVQLGWIPAMEAFAPSEWVSRGPRSPQGPALMLFQTVIVAFLAFVPAWMLASLAVRWAQQPRLAA